jgi:hypothetical protein
MKLEMRQMGCRTTKSFFFTNRRIEKISVCCWDQILVNPREKSGTGSGVGQFETDATKIIP